MNALIDVKTRPMPLGMPVEVSASPVQEIPS
jgi:hypothetical protein